MKDKPVNFRGTQVEPPKGPATWIGASWRKKICTWLTCLLNPKIQVNTFSNDGVTPVMIEADVTMAANGWTAVIDLTGNVGGISGIHWQTPKKELDPTISVSENTLVFISPQNPLCTVGLTDLQTGTILMATAGEWLCVKDCPAATVAGYNVPQDPFPGYNTSAPSGTPLTGDADAPTVFWILQKSAC